MKIRSPRYYILRAPATCLDCGAAMPVFALAVPAEHETWEETEPPAIAAKDGCWSTGGACALLFQVEWVCASVRRRLAAVAPDYRLPRQDAGQDAGQGALWSNHCENCEAAAADHELFCEPEGAFVPLSAAQALAIELVRVAEPLEVDAAGYGVDPPGIAAAL